MNLVSRTSSEPAFDLGCFVCCVVVHHQVNRAAWRLRNILVDQFQELDELLMPVLLMAFADHLSGRDIQRREQRSRSMSNVIMRMPLDLSAIHRQQRLAAVQGLNLAL